jgi:hypothetical protein
VLNQVAKVRNGILFSLKQGVDAESPQREHEENSTTGWGISPDNLPTRSIVFGLNEISEAKCMGYHIINNNHSPSVGNFTRNALVAVRT